MAEEKEKEENIWRRKISFFVEKRSRERKYLLKENMFKWRIRRTEKEKEENNIGEGKIVADEIDRHRRLYKRSSRT